MNTYQPKNNKQVSENIFATRIPGLYFVQHKTYPDERGFFSEIGLIPQLNQLNGFNFSVKQINHAHSLPNVARGFHGENWNKFVTIISGVAFCALADIRPDSDSFSTVEAFILGSGEEALDGSLFISAGIANSVCVVKGPVDYMYQVDQLYQERDTSSDVAISLFDPDLKVSWPIRKQDMIISKRDSNSITLQKKFPIKFP